MKKKVLIVAANPKDTARLRLDEEIRGITQALKRGQRREIFEIETLLAATPSNFQVALLDFQPNIVHFAGHGQGEAGLVFENEHGESHLVSAEALAGSLAYFKNTVECVVLNANYSEIQAQAVARHIHYVIGMSGMFSDRAAQEFAVTFYDALGAGQTIEFSYQLACNAIQMAGIPEHLIPVLIATPKEDVSIEEDNQAYKQVEKKIESVKNILILAASPKSTSRLRLDEESRQIYFGLQRSQHGEKISINQKWATRLQDVSRAMLELAPNIVHFIGHGEESAIVFEDETGHSKSVSPKTLATFFELFSDTVKCVFLNGCYSEGQAQAIAQHIDYVIGISPKILDKAAVKFAVAFYTALGFERAIDVAYEFACAAIEWERMPEDLTPVLVTKNKKESISEQRFEVKDESEYPMQRKPFERLVDPYRSGNLIQELQRGNTNMFFGRRETIQELKTILIDNDEGLVFIYGQRRAGKSCLMKYIEKTGEFEPDLHIIFVDVQGISSEQSFYAKVLKQLSKITGSTQEMSTKVNSFDEFTESLEELIGTTDQRILIMIDEFEHITSEHFTYTSLSDAHEFIKRIRNLIQYTPDIKFALAGADRLKEMVNDYHNPLFKAGRTFHIAFLSSQDARDLITQPLADKVNYTEQAIAAIQDASYNQPYYIQCLCQKIVWLLNKKESYTVTLTEVQEAIEDIEKAEKDMFEYVWDITCKESHLVLAVLAEEMQQRTWIPIDRIEEVIREHNVHIEGDIIDGPLQELLERDFAVDNGNLEYTIPIGLLNTWIKRYKTLKRVRREFV